MIKKGSKVKIGKKAKKVVGRPTTYTEKLAAEILERLINGECLESICKDKHTPVVSTVFEWRKKNPSFSKAYSRARKLQAEVFSDQIKLMVDKVVVQAEQCDETQGAASKIKSLVEAVKLRAGMYQWLAGKYNRKKFGDHQQVTSKNDNYNRDLSKMSLDERMNRVKELGKNFIEENTDKEAEENTDKEDDETSE